MEKATNRRASLADRAAQGARGEQETEEGCAPPMRKRCLHGKHKKDCVQCNPCPHGKLKYNCAACKSARAGQAEIKHEPEVKLEPEIKQEPFTICGYFGIGE